jgi:SAM-dependent methyltransferase
MSVRAILRSLLPTLAACLLSAAVSAQAPATTQKPYEPQVGQGGKDGGSGCRRPSPGQNVDTAKVTPADFHMDLGSGDGRTVIAAAKRGARSMGVEYNPDMVELAKRNAAKEGVSARATFVKADLFETDFSKATVVTMFLLPDINLKLRPKILELKPGTRIVSNTFTMGEWEPDQTQTITGDCPSWCTAPSGSCRRRSKAPGRRRRATPS